MTVFVGSGGSWKEWLPNTSVGSGGANKTILSMHVGTSGVWKQFFTNYTVTADNVSASNSGASPSGTVTSLAGDTNTAVTGGTAPYTYAWTHVSTTTGNTPTISDAAASDPSWSATVSDGTISLSTWKLTVTDSASATVETDITVELQWTNTT